MDQQEQIDFETMLDKLPFDMQVDELEKRERDRKRWNKFVELLARGERDEATDFAPKACSVSKACAVVDFYHARLFTDHALSSQFMKVYEEHQIAVVSIGIMPVDTWPELISRRNEASEKLTAINSAAQHLANAAYKHPEFFVNHIPLSVFIARQREKAAKTAESEQAKPAASVTGLLKTAATDVASV